MGVAAHRPAASPGRVICEACGTELDRPQIAEAASPCPVCPEPRARVIPTHPREKPRETIRDNPVVPIPSKALSSDARKAISEIVSRGPQDESPRLVADLVNNRRREAKLLSLIPIVGSRLVRNRDLLSAKEKRRLATASALFAALATLAMVMLVPPPSQRADATRARIESEIENLRTFTESFRSQDGAYPTLEVWRRFAQRADPRFYDPWGRPYLLAVDSSGFTLSTLGRDGTPGGKGEDGDVERHFAGPMP